MSRPESEHSRTRRDVLISAFGAVAAAISGDFLPAEGAMYAADVKGDGYSTSGDPNKIET